VTDTFTFTNTPTNTFTFTNTNTNTNTFTPTNTPTFTFTSTPTATPTNTATNTPDPNLIEDFEDGDTQISPASGGFNGFWNANSDNSPGSNISPAAGAWADATSPGDGSTYAAHVTCGPVTSYANFGFTFMNPSAAVNLSAYTGIVFDVKMDAGSGSNILRVSVSDVDTDAAGGVCSSCSDYHSGNVCMSTSWQSVTIFWNQLAQAGWGNPQAAFKPAQIYGVFFQFPQNKAMGVWVDNIRLTSAAAPPALTNKNVSDFDFNTGGTNLNSNLAGLLAGNLGWTTYVFDNSIQLPFVQCGGNSPNLSGNTTAFAAHVAGTMASDGGYRSANISANFYNGAGPYTYYDISSYGWTGIKFDINVVTMTSPLSFSFFVPLSTTTQGAPGTCAASCWDHFGYSALPAAGSGWHTVTIPFTSLARGGWGGALTPCSNTVFNDGCNNKNVLQFQWAAAAGTNVGSYAYDWWVDNVTFY
jgi:hypothetical protein